MNVKRSMCSLVCELLNLEFKSEQFMDVMNAAVRYIAGSDTAFVFQKKINKLVDFSSLNPIDGQSSSAKVFRLALLDSGYVAKNIKFYILNLVKMRGLTGDKANISGQDFDIKMRDRKMIYQMLSRIPKLRSEISRSAKIKPIKTADVSLKAFKQVDVTFREVYPKVIKCIKANVYRKLRFVSSSTNTEFADLYNDITVKVIQTFYQLVPTKQSAAYIINYVNRAVHNHVVNMINAYTTQKRARLVNTGKDTNGFDTFELKTVSENQIRITDADGEQVSYDTLMSIDLLDDQLKRTESKFSISQLFDRYSATVKKSRMLSILTGKEDNQFTAWLRDKKHIRLNSNMTNVEFQERCCPKLFVELARKFTRLRKSVTRRFLKIVYTALTGEDSSDAAAFI